MNAEDKLNLQKMINANDVADCTDEIRAKRHSGLIRTDVNRMIAIKRKNAALQQTNPDALEELLIADCNFLFINYTDIFNKVRKDEIDLNILSRLLDVLESIENGKLDQHSGSYQVGTLLKEMYVDSALKKAKKLDEQHQDEQPVMRKPKSISWKQYAASNPGKVAK
jgi:hypothetical protein